MHCAKHFEMSLLSRFLNLGNIDFWAQIIFWCLHVLLLYACGGETVMCIIECLAPSHLWTRCQ